MRKSHESTPKPSPLLALIALALVHRWRPAWCAIDLSTAAAEVNVRPERLSRLVTRGLALFEGVVGQLTKLGRPTASAPALEQAQQLGLARALLEVATGVLKMVAPAQRRRARYLIVGAWVRLRSQHPTLTQAAFAEALSVPPRTLRSWIKNPRPPDPPPVIPPRSSPLAPTSRLKRPRFRFDLRLPGVQFGSDTTDLRAFDVGLKLIGGQDIGGRDRDLLDTVIIDDHEDAQLVEKMMIDALRGLQGAQMLTDQGTPYMAESIKAAMARLEVEHAPQKEGDPQGKSTVERAFKSIKSFAGPLLDLTNHIAAAVPQLKDVALAKAATAVLITALLRAYQAGGRAARRACQQVGKLSEEQLVAAAEKAREAARALDRSARLFLAHVHQIYGLTRNETTFVNQLRLYPLPVLQDAERRFRTAVHRADIRDRSSYFAAIVRDCHHAFKAGRARQQAQDERRAILEADCARAAAQWRACETEPVAHLRKALDLIAHQWQPKTQTLLADGVGLGTAWLRQAVVAMLQQYGPIAARDVGSSLFRDFERARQSDLGKAGVRAVQGVLERILATSLTVPAQDPLASRPGGAIIGGTGKFRHPQLRTQLPI
jgi:uncharacterized protein YjeT (DUF2065 family)